MNNYTHSNKKKLERFYQPLINNNMYAIFEMKNNDLESESQLRKIANKNNFVIKLTIKRLIHKLFYGTRSKNEKVKFKNQKLFIIYPNINPMNNHISVYENMCQILNNNRCNIHSIIYEQKELIYSKILLCHNFNKINLMETIIDLLYKPVIFSLLEQSNQLSSK